MEFKTKEFTVLTPFSIVTKDASVTDSTGNDIIKIAGMANFSGSDDQGGTYVDLVGDVVMPSGVDTSVWSINPQILWQHDREETIGEGILLEKRPDGIYIECFIHKGAMEDQDWYRVKSGLVKMFSIGFRTLDGTYQTIGDEDVFFITKCLLLEVSIVSIPANSKSSFSLVKSLNGGFTSDRKVALDTNSKGTQHKIDKEEILMNIKIKRSDMLSVADLETFKALGGDSETEVEVDIASYLKGLVAQEVASVLAAKEKELAELKAAEEAKAITEAEEAAKLEAEAKAAEDAAAESAKLEEEKALADEFAEYKALVETLKTAIAEEK